MLIDHSLFLVYVLRYLDSQDMGDEWGMGMNGDQLLPIHPRGDEWKMNGG